MEHLTDKFVKPTSEELRQAGWLPAGLEIFSDYKVFQPDYYDDDKHIPDEDYTVIVVGNQS